MKRQQAEIVQEYGPFADADAVHGVTFDGRHVWFASGDRLNAMDPGTGVVSRSIEMTANAGSAFDGRHLYQIADDRIHKLDAATGKVLATIPAPSGSNSGLAWAEGSLWVGQYHDRVIHEIDPDTGAVRRSLRSDRYVTGISWLNGDLWHGTWENDESELRRIDAATGEVLARLDMPAGVGVSGLESDGTRDFFCGGGSSGRIRRVRLAADR